jgi:hypothetical protein
MQELSRSNVDLIQAIWIGAVLLAGFLIKCLFPLLRKHREQVRFIRETLSGGNGKSGGRRVIVSFTTVPQRIGNLQPTIQSLLRQTRPPDEILIAVPEFSIREQRAYVVPKYLSRLPGVRILRCGRDWGPATKFIPAVREEMAAGRDDTLIMVVDDDRVYPRDALESYLHYNEQLPDAALCFRGAPMPRSFDWREARMFYANELRHPRRVAVITGCGSYFIQPQFFDESLWDYSGAPRGAFYMDDIWISGWLSCRSIERYAVPASAMMRSVLRQNGTLSLHDVSPSRQYNNNETIAFFRDAWDIFASPLKAAPSEAKMVS